MLLNIKLKQNIIKVKKSGRGINSKNGRIGLLKCPKCKKEFWISVAVLKDGNKFCCLKCRKNYYKHNLVNYDSKGLKNFLIKEYINNRKSQKAIAKIMKCTGGLVSYYLKKLDIPIRTISKAKIGIPNPKLSLKMKGRYKGKNNPNWKGGISLIPYPFKFNKELKKLIRTRDNNLCQLCIMSNEEHINRYGHDLLIHHIDYNKNNLKHNNLITACRPCNTIINFNRAFWTKYFKNIIRSIYESICIS